MSENLSITHLVRLACIKETEAQLLYLKTAEIADDEATAMLLEQLAAEELTHKEGLEKLDASDVRIDDEQAKRIGECFGGKDSPLPPEASFSDVIRYAIHREEQAVGFYDRLAGAVPEGPVRQFLTERANDERGHKARLEALCKRPSV